jgi:hypothetical protein
VIYKQVSQSHIVGVYAMKKIVSIILVSGVFAITGCAAQPPTLGDRMQADGKSQIKLSEQWERGKKETTTGDKQIKNGRVLVDKGRSSVRKGERLITSGNIEAQTHRQSYQALSQTIVGIDSGEAALERVSILKNIATAWEDGEEKVSKGKGLIKSGNEDISKGESEIRNGQELISAGRNRMQDAESRY